MYRSVTALLVSCVTGLWAATVAAAPVSSFAFGQANYWATPGSKVDVSIYWQQVIGDGETSVLDLASAVGMFGQGVQVRWDDPVMPSQPATVISSTADIACNAGFNDTDSMHRIVTDSYAQLSEVTDGMTFVYGAQTNPSVWRQLIGTFSFTAGTVPGEVTHLLATRYVGPFDGETYIIDADGRKYDGETGLATATITVTTPEPGSLALLTVGLGVLLAYVLRRSNQLQLQLRSCVSKQKK